MRIGIDARMYAGDFTGIGRYTYELIRHVTALDPENEYVVFLRAAEYDRFEPPTPRVKKVLADFRHYSWGEQWGFWRLLMRQKLDLMHFTHFNAPVLYRRPYIVTIHDLTLSFFPGKKMTRWWQRFAYQFVIRRVVRHARKVIAVSRNTKSDLQKLLRVPDSKIDVIYHGIDPGFGRASSTAVLSVKQKYQLTAPYFLYTGVWRDHKNVTGMLRAFSVFLENTPYPIGLVMTGKEDPFYPEVKATIRDLGIEKNVRLVGLVPEEDLRGLYQGAFAYVFPSFYEGFGFPPLEAMKSGVPVLASNTSSIPEICGEGNALYFDPYDVPDMVRAMTEIARDPALRASLIERGKRHAASFQWEPMAKQALDLYHSFE